MNLVDTRGRTLRDLRISITDRCNFRCRYCMPKEIFNREYEFLQRELLLSFEEITRLTRVFTKLGVDKVRITGGEPLLRKGVETLIASLGGLGLRDLTLTTNGSLLSRKAESLAAAGLRRITVSLDSLDAKVFAAMNDVDFPVSDVLEGIEAAATVGLTPVKINMVVKRGVNSGGILPMAEHFRGTGHIVRFIEFMDVGVSNGWRLDDVVPAQEILETINDRYPLEPVEPNYKGEVAGRWRYRDGAGEIGVITSISQPFCGDCTRARLSAEGVLYTCLFATGGIDFRGPIRDGASDADLTAMITDIWERRTDRYSEMRSEATVNLPKVEMSYIGG
ncbi:MAG: GTP 3',8-cyclase MoaA [Acidimicrobiia bacterium]|nr:GTP 3',8-cyclase MoaA [Acidimicrobiia bacterium]